MPAILLYLGLRLAFVLTNPNKSVRLVLRSRPWHVWALWSLGVVVVLGLWEFDPGLVVYLADPELLAGVMLLAAYQVRRSIRTGWAFVGAMAHRCVLRWEHVRTSTSVGLQLYATSIRQRLAPGLASLLTR